MWTRLFWAQAAERAIKTFAQVAIAMMSGDGLGLLEVNWTRVLAVAALATVASVLTSLVSAPVGAEPQSPSLVRVD